MIATIDHSVQTNALPSESPFLFVLDHNAPMWLNAIPMARRYVLRTYGADVRITRCSSPIYMNGDAGLVFPTGASLLIEADRDDMDAVRRFCELLMWREPKVRKVSRAEVERLFASKASGWLSATTDTVPVGLPGSYSAPRIWDPLTTVFSSVPVGKNKDCSFRFAIRGKVNPADLDSAIRYVQHREKVRVGIESEVDWAAVGFVPNEVVLSLDVDKEEAAHLVATLICDGAFQLVKVEDTAAPAASASNQVLEEKPNSELAASTGTKFGEGEQTLVSCADSQVPCVASSTGSNVQSEPVPPSKNILPSARPTRKNPRRPRAERRSVACPGATPFYGFVPDFVDVDWEKARPKPRARDKDGKLRSGRVPVMQGARWLVHMLVIAQKTATVIIPDVLLGQQIWGGDKNLWPDNWKGWLAGRFGREKIHRECSAACPMRRSGVGHGHIHYTIENLTTSDRDKTFLGALEDNGHTDESGERRYDWTKFTGPDQSFFEKQAKSDRNTGRRCAVYLPLLLFGASPRMKLSREQRQLLLAVTHELTRSPRSSRAGGDKGQIITGGQKIIEASGFRVSVYPDLQRDQPYVAFNGNGKGKKKHLHGKGYHLIGRTGKGWLTKSGYGVPDDDKERSSTVKQFLADLDVLADRFGLVVAGWHGKNREWRSLAEMRRMARNQAGRRWLDECLVRVYTPADYLARWRQHFASQMGFTAIPGGPDEIPVSEQENGSAAAIRSAIDLDMWMKRFGVTNKQLAVRLNVSSAWVSYQRSGKKPWCPDFQKDLEACRVEWESGVAVRVAG